MAKPTQIELLGYIDAAECLYERVYDKLPTAKQIQRILLSVDVEVSLERIQVNLEVLQDLDDKDAPILETCPYCQEMHEPHLIEQCPLKPRLS